MSSIMQEPKQQPLTKDQIAKKVYDDANKHKSGLPGRRVRLVPGGNAGINPTGAGDDRLNDR
jgi:hypothetical protein